MRAPRVRSGYSVDAFLTHSSAACYAAATKNFGKGADSA